MSEPSESQEVTGKSESEDITAGLEGLQVSEADSDDLFGPPPPRDECPICMLLLPLDPEDSTYMSCCGKIICYGCTMEHARVITETNEKKARRDRNRDQGGAPLVLSCAFCRKPPSVTYEQIITELQKRMKLNDPLAFFNLARYYEAGEGVPKDERKAFELLLHAAKLGHAGACCNVAQHYRFGQVVDKDETKGRAYLEMGVKKGDTVARYNLGVLEYKNGNVDLAIEHFLISACAGDQDSLDAVKEQYKEGNVSKDDFARALRCFHAARKEEWSKEREAAKRGG